MPANDAYHGTVWSKPLWSDDQQIDQVMVFDLDAQHNELGAAFFSDKESVAEAFASRNFFDRDNQIVAIVRAELNPTAVKTVQSTGGPSSLSLDGREFGLHEVEDRKVLHEHLRQSGVQAFVMEGDYMDDNTPAHDIAILDNNAMRSTQVKLKLGDDWSPWLSKNEAKEVMAVWADTDSLEEAHRVSVELADRGPSTPTQVVFQSSGSEHLFNALRDNRSLEVESSIAQDNKSDRSLDF